MILGQALRDQQRELIVFRHRLMLAGLVIIAAFAVLLGASLAQVVQRSTTTRSPSEPLDGPVVPNRGLILDRNGAVLAANYSAYTLEITP
jgi:penicillin-binding protein 2